MTLYVDKAAYFREIGYKPHSAAQRLYHTSKARFRVPVCGRRFGKSDMAAKDLEPELLLPNRRYWIVGPTYDLGDKEFRVIWDDLIIKKQLGRDKRVRKAYNKKQGEMYIEFPWQTRIEVRSAGHPETLVGDSLHGVIMSEAAKHNRETWDRYIRSALSDYRGWATFPTTPEGMNWLYLLWQLGQNPAYKGVYESWNFPSWENPIVYPGGRQDPEILLLEDTMAIEEFLQEIAAQFTAFKGRIYGEFEEKIHVKQHVYNPAWPNYITWDFGYRDALAAIEFQVDPWQNVYVWREHYGSFKTLETHISEMKSRIDPEGYKIELMFGDSADPEAIAYLNEHYGGTMGDPMAKVNWRQGIDLVKSFLKLRDVGLYDEYERPIEKPSLWVDHSCVNTIREFNNYKTKETPQGLRESNASGAAQRQDDHAMDALRYGIMHVFALGATSHLSDVTDKQELHNEAPEDGYFTLEGMKF